MDRYDFNRFFPTELFMNLRYITFGCSILLAFTASTFVRGQTAREKIGFDQLQAEVGAGLEDGSGILVGQVEAPDLNGNYLPNLGSGQFTGKSITDGSGIGGAASGHAQGVAIRQYGRFDSVASGTSDITIYEANDWIGRVLGFDAGVNPLTQNFSVMNHSYIANGFTTAEAVEYNRRLDFVAERDNVTMVVGVLNSPTASLPQLFSQSYSAIVVGRENGSAHGFTTIDGAGRIKPDISAPEASSSNAAPLVAATAAVLHQQGMNSGNADATRIEVVKSVIMAGATKDEYPTWENTPTRPLDDEFGAGELNIYNSYRIMEAGEFDGTLGVPSAAVGRQGWDYGEAITTGQEIFYDFDFASDMEDGSILLTWNPDITDSGGDLDFDTLTLADLNLRLFDRNTNMLVAESISTVDNVEHLYFSTLDAGQYRLGVSSLSGSTDYGLAWRFTAVPEPSAFVVISICSLGLALGRRKRS